MPSFIKGTWSYPSLYCRYIFEMSSFIKGDLSCRLSLSPAMCLTPTIFLALIEGKSTNCTGETSLVAAYVLEKLLPVISL